MIISLVAAASTNHVIGKDNQLLWHLPNDLKFFKNTTWGMPVIMGRKTFESVNSKPLPGRTNIIISKRVPAGIAVNRHLKTAASLKEAIQIAGTTDAREVFIVGGGQVYAEALPLAHKIYLTRVHTIIEGDRFFPEFGRDEWKQVSQLDFSADQKHAYAYSFQVWERK